MEAVILTKDQYQELVVRMDEIKSALTEKQKEPKDVFLDNQDFLQLMNISKRTAQSWRDEGIISFSQVGSKIYYRMSDVQKLLDSNYYRVNPKMDKDISMDDTKSMDYLLELAAEYNIKDCINWINNKWNKI